MSHSADVENMLRNFRNIDAKPTQTFNPFRENYCFMIANESDGHIYHYSTVIEMINNGFTIGGNQFKRTTDMSQDEINQYFKNKKP